MKCYLFLPESELEDRISESVCRTLKNRFRAKVYFFHPQRIGAFTLVQSDGVELEQKKR